MRWSEHTHVYYRRTGRPVVRNNNYKENLKTKEKNQSRNHIRGARLRRNTKCIHRCIVCCIMNSFMSVCVYNINNTAKQARCKRSV